LNFGGFTGTVVPGPFGKRWFQKQRDIEPLSQRTDKIRRRGCGRYARLALIFHCWQAFYFLARLPSLHSRKLFALDHVIFKAVVLKCCLIEDQR
jgi:hypothetical protein